MSHHAPELRQQESSVTSFQPGIQQINLGIFLLPRDLKTTNRRKGDICNTTAARTYRPSPKLIKRNNIMGSRVAQMQDVLRRADAVCFDVDSTVLVEEAIDELASFCGVGEEVEKMTSRAMNGGMCYRRSLGGRLEIMKPSLDSIASYVDQNPPKLTPGISELVSLLQSRGTQVYLVSGGFESVIQPIARELNIPQENIFANRLMFFHDGEYAGFDESQPVSESGGKTRVAEHLKSKFGYKNLVFIGDGMTDLETYPTADCFIGFGGNQVREQVKAGAPWFVHTFHELIDVLRNKSDGKNES